MTAPSRDSIVRIGAPVALGVVVLVAWQLVVTVGEIDDYLLPSPLSIVEQIVEFWPALVAAVGSTGLNALIGLVVGSVVGILVALLASLNRVVDHLSAPLVAGLAVVPIVALAPVLNTMFGADSETGRRTIAGLAVFVPVFINTLRGLRQTDPVHRDLMRSYAAGPGQVVRVLTIPAARPYIVTGIRVASSLAVISALVAEYFGGPRGGLGSLISSSAATSAYARAWAYVVGGIVLGLLFFVATAALERAATPRRLTVASTLTPTKTPLTAPRKELT
ncbi:ABC transporter permease [Marisediminicola sp. LYQ85]|uniref:ABC transporter permease n=1 Tax=Marisediminicola sp. LYQ85 TaxID=3391062 RepID=UPI003983A9BC